MKISLLISILFHVILFLAFQQSFPSLWDGPESRTYNVEIFRVSTDTLYQNEIPENGGSRFKDEQSPTPQDETANISLDTKDIRYVDYTKAIKERIQKTWKYPAEARKGRIEGKLLLLFSLESNGNLVRVDIKERSGHEILDEEATRAIFASAPFPAFPGQIKVRRLNIKAVFDYRLK